MTRRLRNLVGGTYGVLAGNVVARLVAMGAIMLATLLLAHRDGPAAVGIYALLHVLPALVGSVISCGLAVSAAYFLAGPDRNDPRLPLTLLSIALVGGVGGLLLWFAATPLMAPLLFPSVPFSRVFVAGIAVATRLVVISAKSCSQGKQDLRGSNFVIAAEETMFLPVYGVLALLGARGYTIVVLGLVLSDCVTGSLAWWRLSRRGFFEGAVRPSWALARRMAAYGTRGQVGGLMLQLNLRLDFIILSAIAGPAVLGMYAIASKFAELIKVGTLALSYVLYPEFARDVRDKAVSRARRLIPRAGLLSAAAAIPLLITAGFVITKFYGKGFHPAILPARIILLGLVLDGIGGVVTGYLYGVGRPGMNSWSMGIGLIFTVVLDVLLIPKMGATGGAIASAIAYTATTVALLVFFRRVSRAATAPPPAERRSFADERQRAEVQPAPGSPAPGLVASVIAYAASTLALLTYFGRVTRGRRGATAQATQGADSS
jgi:O-antigen/teichoic acid export membrane protein